MFSVPQMVPQKVFDLAEDISLLLMLMGIADSIVSILETNPPPQIVIQAKICSESSSFCQLALLCKPSGSSKTLNHKVYQNFQKFLLTGLGFK